MSARSIALRLLVDMERKGQYSNLALDHALQNEPLSPKDKALLTTLFYGVIEKQITLDYYIRALSSRPIETLDTEVLGLVRLGLYQLIFLDRIPAHAAINESVALAGRKRAGFVNAILREYTRRGADIPLPDKETHPIAYLSVNYSYPESLCELFEDLYSFEECESLLGAFNRPQPLTLRVNTLKTTREDLLARLHAKGVSAEICPHAPHGIRCEGGAVRDLPGFDEGHFFVQDEASQLCVETLDAREGHTVIDTCACPGSKSFGIAMSMNNKGVLHAFDLHKNKLSLVETGARRLGIDILRTAARDGRIFVPELEESADRILCDVPCSGLGIVAKKPEIRYKNLDDIKNLPDIQLAILENASPYLHPNGVLVYSTCTLVREENENNVARFLTRHPEFTLSPFAFGDLAAGDGMLTLRPDITGTDGFFIAKLVRKQ